MTQAIFGLVGVVVGALVSGSVAYTLTRRAEKRKALASARLVENELREAKETLRLGRERWTFMRRLWEVVGETRHLPRPDVPIFSEISTSAWAEHQGLLAESLTKDEWEGVSGAYRSLEWLRGEVIIVTTAEGQSMNRQEWNERLKGVGRDEWLERVKDVAAGLAARETEVELGIEALSVHIGRSFIRPRWRQLRLRRRRDGS